MLLYSAGAEDYLQPFDDNDVPSVRSHTVHPEPPEFLQAVEIIMRENNLQFPLTIQESFSTINNLLHTIL